MSSDEFKLGELSSKIDSLESRVETLELEAADLRDSVDGNVNVEGLRTSLRLVEVQLETLNKVRAFWTNWKFYLLVTVTSVLINILVKNLLHW